MKLYLIRHGQSHVNLKSWTGGNRDTDLTDLGRNQARALAAWLPSEVPVIDVLYSSTMARAMETAGYISEAYSIPIQPDERIREIGNNRMDHEPWPSDDLPEYGDLWGSARPFSSITPERDQGESLMHFRTRVGSFVEEMAEKHRGQNVVAVCHGGVVEGMFAHTFNIGPFWRCEVWCFNTGITHFEYVEHPDREAWRLHYHSRIDHLSALEEIVDDVETII